MQRAILQEKDLTYQNSEGLVLCMATELATKDISLLQQKLVEVKCKKIRHITKVCKSKTRQLQTSQ